MKNGVEVIDAGTAKAFDWSLTTSASSTPSAGARGRSPTWARPSSKPSTPRTGGGGHPHARSGRGPRLRGVPRARLSTLVKRHVPDASFVAC